MAWHHASPSGRAPAPRAGHAATCLDGVRVLVHGGWNPAVSGNEAEYTLHRDLAILDTASWVWSRPTVRGASPCARVGHTLVPFAPAGQTSLYAFGGRGEGDKALNDTYRLSPAAK